MFMNEAATLCVIAVLSLMCSCMGTKSRVVVAGASGYIGRAVVSELASRENVEVLALLRRPLHRLPICTQESLKGSTPIVVTDMLDEREFNKVILECKPSHAICCLASRDGLAKSSWAVDYGMGSNLLRALEALDEKDETRPKRSPHFVLLSAFCCGKPLLQFQFAKLKLEEELQKQRGVTYSIVRPTAYFKSLDGQIEAARKGNPLLYFGDGTCSANAISEGDLARYLADCALDPESVDGGSMLNAPPRNIGGPDVPPLTKRQQAELIYDTLGVPQEKRRFISLPLALFSFLDSFFSGAADLNRSLGFKQWEEICGDAAEIVRIVRYYAEEPMVALGAGEVHGTTTLADHFQAIADNGGQLKEIDEYTTTVGGLNKVVKKEYVDA